MSLWSRVAAVAAGCALALSAPAEAAPRGGEVIVQLQPGTPASAGRALLARAGAAHVRAIPLIHGFAASVPARAAAALAHDPAVRAVSPTGRVAPQGAVDSSRLATAYDTAVNADKLWSTNLTGKGVGVAVVDTGIDGGQPDFQTSATDAASRVIASAVTNPAATSAGDEYGHGTHVAGIIAGNA